MRIYRLTPDGKRWAPAKENGFFVLGDPQMGNVKHKAENAVRVRSEQEAIDLLLKGFSIRVETPARPSLVRRNISLMESRLLNSSLDRKRKPA